MQWNGCCHFSKKRCFGFTHRRYQSMSWTTLLQNKNSKIRTRALGALTGISSDPSQLSLELSKFTLNLTTMRLNRYISTARKIYNCRLFVKCVSDKKEYQMSVLNAPCSSHPSDLPIVKCS